MVPLPTFLKQYLFPFWSNALIEPINVGEAMSFIHAAELQVYVTGSLAKEARVVLASMHFG